jgi:hypothetical protein
MNTTHILRQFRKQGGNQFYKDRSNRSQGTFCGAPVVAFGVVRWYEKCVPWTNEAGEQFEPCAECVRLRDEFRAARSKS